ncbi:hypothetical protein MNEG_15166 [Monoraphidium neglectum]|uniref:SAM-dependent MTase RsmB/NOP-type domain-containing protein n=1 Tax=Monoraphidium neglectum TaxID=145388 RepID=A0A0D2IXZ4_9CHLO|nr:hypothetical protein MNEG_15166 [Monoraphidium neglectum]KIY92797.1 hypothetical protein MNEG_15166 [Monoraphidium neglectum]|eukprot:XP_013891817.1 hypothetical protein MNEG_15166 [Monoraphidium neglectum]
MSKTPAPPQVLDMCAAPGSKTFQLLEMLHQGSSHGQAPQGIVVANDADGQRCNLLTHQTKRMCSPCLMITNHSGEMFPRMLDPAAGPADANADAAAGEEAAGEEEGVGDGEGEEGAAAAGAGGGRRRRAKPARLLFDRILADVPCSGDGTMRKSPDIWNRWGVAAGNGLHMMQLKIALQGARLLKVGGRMVYSTCTFNPIEDEAVVADLLVRCGGALRLVDVDAQLPQLKRMPGLKTWKVRDRFQWYESWDDAAVVGNKLSPTMFPSPEKAALPLERCMRFLPHHNDTGGFFVAVIEKVAPIDALPDPDHSFRLRPMSGIAKVEEGAEAGAAAELRAAAAAAAEYALRGSAGGRRVAPIVIGGRVKHGRAQPSHFQNR